MNETKNKKCICGADMVVTLDKHLICSRYFENLKLGIKKQREMIEQMTVNN